MADPKRIFISYSSDDQDKVDILKRMIDKTEGLKHIVIADKREAQKLLTEKVTEGIQRCSVVVPILTNKSIHAQWINQEIGYSSAKDKEIKAVVEREIINDLRGFIHKQLDLPYAYSRGENSDQESSEFHLVCELLISDILEGKAKPVPMKSLQEKTLDDMKQVADNEKFNREKAALLSEPEMISKVIREVDTVLIPGIRSTKEAWEKEFLTKIPFDEGPEDSRGLTVIFKGHSLMFLWANDYYNSIENSKLTVILWDSPIKFDFIRDPIIEDNPEKLKEKVFVTDLDREYKVGWSNSRDWMTTEQVVEMGFAWLSARIMEQET